MAPIKFFNILVVSTLVLFACSFGPSSVNALATGDHVVRDMSVHHALAKKKREASSNSKHCKTKPKSHSAKPKPKSKPKPKATGGSSSSHNTNNYKNEPSSQPKPSSTNTGSSTSSGGSVSSKVGLAWPNGNDASLKNFNTGKKPPWVAQHIQLHA